MRFKFPIFAGFASGSPNETRNLHLRTSFSDALLPWDPYADSLKSNLPFPRPFTDADARSMYLGLEWSTRDPTGNTRSAPEESLWTRNEEEVPDWVFPECVISFVEKPVGSGSTSEVYSIIGHPGWVIKYNTYCPCADDPVDTNLRESYFLTLVSAIAPRVTNRIKYFSGERRVDSPSKLKSASYVDPVCPDSEDPVLIRFIISERVGIDLFEYIATKKSRSLPFLEAIDLGIQLFMLLNELHAADVVHGDLHMGNVAFRMDRPNELLLIDFGRASIRPDIDDSEGGELFCDWRLSPWESYGFGPRTTFRDDAFRAAIILARMMHGPLLESAQEDICSDRNMGDEENMYMDFKLRMNFFDTEYHIPGYRTRVDLRLAKLLSPNQLAHSEAISTILDQALEYIQELRFDTRPDYEYILSLLQSIKDIQ